METIGKTYPQKLRIALVSTPRSGNTWIRETIGKALELNQFAVHRYWDMPSRIPDRCIMQIHWRKDPEFQRFLSENRFQVVTIARHPLDVLLSILKFSQHRDDVDQWLDGQGGHPSRLKGKGERSTRLLRYGASKGFGELLGVTTDWWLEESSIRIRYERAIRAPTREIFNACKSFGGNKRDIQRAIMTGTREVLPQHQASGHFWKGASGLGNRMLPLTTQLCTFARHRESFHIMNYSLLAKNRSKNYD